MIAKRLWITLIGVCLLPSWNAVADNPFAGYWDVSLNMRGREMPAKLAIQERGGTLSGYWITPRGRDSLERVRVDQGVLKFIRKLDRPEREIALKYELTIRDGNLSGKIITPRSENVFSGKPAATNSDEIDFPRDRRDGPDGGSFRSHEEGPPPEWDRRPPPARSVRRHRL